MVAGTQAATTQEVVLVNTDQLVQAAAKGTTEEILRRMVVSHRMLQ